MKNKVYLRCKLNKISFKLYYYKSSDIAHFRVFGCKYYLLTAKELFKKIDNKTDECIFMEYPSHNMAYMMYNKKTKLLE